MSGTLSEFIPGQNARPAAMVALDEPMIDKDLAGDIVVLELRYAGATWEATGTAHLELCDFHPERARWHDRRRGRWIESHASYRLLGG